MTELIPKYLGVIRRKTNAQLLAWQGFTFIKYSSLIITAILMARLIPNIELIKTYEKILLITSSLSFFFVSGLGQTVIPYFESQDVSNKKTIFKTLFYLLFTLGLLSSLLLVFYSLIYSSENTSSYVIFAIITLLNIPSFALENYYLVHKMHVNLLTWGLFTYLLQIPVFIIPVLLYNSLDFGLYGLLGIAALKFVYTAYALQVSKHFKRSVGQLMPFLGYSWPVLLSFTIGGSYVYINAIIVELNLPSKEFILYRYGAREFPLFLIIANSFSLIYSAKIARGLKNNNPKQALKAFKLKSTKVMNQLFPIAILLMLCSQFLFKFFYSNSYAESFLVFNIMLFLLMSRMLFPQTLLLGYGLTKYFTYASLIELITGVTLSLYLVKIWGLFGVSLAMVIAFMAEKIYLILVCYRHHITFFKLIPSLHYLGYSTLLLICFLISLF